MIYGGHLDLARYRRRVSNHAQLPPFGAFDFGRGYDACQTGPRQTNRAAGPCVNCHLAPGQADTEIRPGLYPKLPNLFEQRVDPKTAMVQ